MQKTARCRDSCSDSSVRALIYWFEVALFDSRKETRKKEGKLSQRRKREPLPLLPRNLIRMVSPSSMISLIRTTHTCLRVWMMKTSRRWLNPTSFRPSFPVMLRRSTPLGPFPISPEFFCKAMETMTLGCCKRRSIWDSPLVSFQILTMTFTIRYSNFPLFRGSAYCGARTRRMSWRSCGIKSAVSQATSQPL